MTDTVFGPLRGFGDDARRALAAATDEAAALGHDWVGTEHVLLGLLHDEGVAGRALRGAGITAAAARHKVEEAVPSGSGQPPQRATKRATRTVDAAVRVSDNRRAESVGTVDLLLGLLRVEGTAGQILRGLGVDVDRLGAAVDVPSPPAATGPATATRSPVGAARGAGAAPVWCPSCRQPLAGAMRHEVLTATGDDGELDAIVFSCGNCAAVLGVAPAPY